jgi:glutamine synthetase
VLGDEHASGRGSAIAAELAEAGVAAVAFTYVDNSGIARMKGVPVGRLSEAAAWGVGMSPVFDAFLLDDSITASPSAGGPMGDLRLLPDLDRLVVLAAEPGWAWVPVDRWNQSGSRHPQCQRELVRSVTTQAAERGLHARMAFEVEWMLSAGLGDEFVPATTAAAYGTNRVVELSEYCVDLLRALAAQGIEVLQIHPEYAAGQFELSVAAADPLTAADHNLLVRQTIRAVSHRHGLRPSFTPAAFIGGVGNGMHLHMSVWDGDDNLCGGGDGPHGLTPRGEAVLAGVLASLPGMLAVTAPSVASYLRLQPQRWAGVYRCWGLENREAAVRLVTGPADAPSGAANAEVKPIDPTASPYLVAASVLAAGLGGLDAGARLPEEVSVDPASLDDGERAELGVERLPTSLEEATAHLEASDVLRDAFGPALHETLVAVRRAECALFADSTDEEVVAATLWRH